MTQLVKITLREVKRAMIENGVWCGYIVADNVNVHHVISGFGFGLPVEVETLDELYDVQQQYASYNHCPEMWRHYGRFHYYSVRE